MVWTTDELVKFIASEFRKQACPEKAGPMAAYMKTDKPFYGIQKPDRVPIYRQMKKRFVPADRKQYEKAVLALWSGRHREEKYAAIEYARQHKDFVIAQSVPLYERLIREGAWWDFVDDIAINLVGNCLLAERKQMRPLMDEWIDDDDMWIRRTAVIAHNHHRDETDARQLFKHCLRRAHENEFFIRKGIGWALREYSYANPAGVKEFLLSNRDKLSPLSFKEGAKQLVRTGIMR